MRLLPSDDPVWCEAELRGEDVFHMGPGNPPEVDLAVMTLCQVIMAS